MKYKTKNPNLWPVILYPPLQMLSLNLRSKISSFYLSHYKSQEILIFNRIGQLLNTTSPKDQRHEIMNVIFSDRPYDAFDLIFKATDEIFYDLFEYLELAAWFCQFYSTRLFEFKLVKALKFLPDLIMEYMKLDWNIKVFQDEDLLVDVNKFRDSLLKRFLYFSATYQVAEFFSKVSRKSQPIFPPVIEVRGFGSLNSLAGAYFLGGKELVEGQKCTLMNTNSEESTR